MTRIVKEIYEELIAVLKGKTLDTLIPPILFVITLDLFSLNIALIASISLSSLLFLFRLYKKEEKKYAALGLIAVSIAALFSYLNQNPISYFIPDILGSAALLVLASVSLIIKKPMAAYASHLTRGWELNWFWRDDIRKAYSEVTFLWLIYFLFRTVLELTLFLQDDVSQFVWINTVLGIPLLIFILTISYIYGMWRLRTLKGPSVEEYLSNKEAPYDGQKRGF